MPWGFISEKKKILSKFNPNYLDFLAQPKRQTQSLHSKRTNHVVQMDGFVTHLCDVHRVNEDLPQHRLNRSQSLDHDLSALKNGDQNTSVEQPSNHKLKQINVTEKTEIQTKENELYSTSSDNVDELDTIRESTPPSPSDVIAQSENDGKIEVAPCTSKESDIENDSGCGSSIHEIPCAESSTGAARLSFKSLAGGNSASRNELCVTNTDETLSLSCSSNSFENKTQDDYTECNSYPKALARYENIVKRYSLKRRSQAEEDTFQRLIQLAKDGMSYEALKVFENFECAMENAEMNTKPILSRSGSKVLLASVDSSKELPDSEPSADIEDTTERNLPSGEDGIHVIQSEVNVSSRDNIEGRALMGNTHAQVDSGVLPSSTSILLSENQQRSIDDGDDSIESALSSSEPSKGQLSVDGTDSTRILPSPGLPVFNFTVPSVDVATKASENDTGKNKSAGEFQARKLKRRTKKQVSFETLPAKEVGQHFAHDSSNGIKSLTCDKTSGFIHEFTDIVKLERKKAFLSVESLATGYPLDKGEQNGTESSTRENSSEETQTIQSTFVQRTSAPKMYSLKVPSLETLHLPSQSSSNKYQKRTRSFSATIRRRLSFRSRQSSDDTDVESGSPEREAAKSKHLKVFRSFRVNKRTKSNSTDSQIWDLESNEANGYRPTFDRIFSEKTEEPIFSDVPFTIPEIGD